MIDEAARVADALCYAVCPMLSISYGKQGCSTTSGTGRATGTGWGVTGEQCGFSPAAFLAEKGNARRTVLPPSVPV